MNYQWFESDTNEAWKHKLVNSFFKIQSDAFNSTQKHLKTPNFSINSNLNYRWAQWNKTTRTIDFSLNLLKQFEWKAVEHIMRHETAHMIVDEIYVMDGKPHGEAWKLACQALNIDPDVTESKDMLDQYKGGNTSPIVEKIRKILIHGNDTGISEGESQVFLKKAHALMVKHNVDMNHIHGIDNANTTFYTFRPVGPLVSGHKTWLGQISYLISQYYNVQSIWQGCYDSRTGTRMKRIEFYGTPDNLDVAEYVFHALITQAEFLYQQFKLEQQRLNYIQKHDPTYVKGWRQTRISKRAFMRGLVTGYTQKLQQSKKVVFDTITPDDKSIILRNDKLLREAYEEEYNPCNLNYGRSRGRGYSDGHKAGSNLTLARGVSSTSNSRQLLNA